ncbi:MAG: hypothetical protein WAW03_10060 [Anaerolineae bacterium]|uniref:hypothetical protein n=1 Tax=Candidatus Amarolinea dominans TaxID=3140696 RepID=UPI003134DF62|nr:hypothetical protein [Anaerolineae bacterium]
MHSQMSIDRFHAMMTSSKPDSPLMTTLRQVKIVQGPERIALRSSKGVSPYYVWTGWNL